MWLVVAALLHATHACLPADSCAVTATAADCYLPSLPLCLEAVPPQATALSLAGLSVPQINSTTLAALSNALTSLLIQTSVYISTVLAASFSQFGALDALAFVDLPALTAVAPGAFQGLNRLSSLSITYTWLQAIAANLFGALGALQTLDLGCNALTSIAADAVDGLPALVQLDLRNNSIPASTLSLIASSTLKSIDVSDNRLTALPLLSMAGLTSFSATGNNITYIPPGVFTGIPKLSALNVSNNAITAVHQLALPPLGLGTLDMRGNTLQCIGLGLRYNCTCSMSRPSATQSIHCGVSCVASSTANDCIASCIRGFEGGGFMLGSTAMDVSNCSGQIARLPVKC